MKTVMIGDLHGREIWKRIVEVEKADRYVFTIIVVDNNGGGIFSTLPQQGVVGFEKIFGTPHDRDIAKIVSGFGISNEVVTSAKELHIALQRIHPNIHVIVAKMPSREKNAEYLGEILSKYRDLVRSS